jgi:hypothetical protein
MSAMVNYHQQEEAKRTARRMSEFAVITVSMKDTLKEIAKQANALGAGLQNAAPGERSGTPNHSVQYLFSIAASLEKIADHCDTLLSTAKK